MLGRSAAIAEKNENDLPCHVERSQEDADQHEVVRNVRTRPVRGGVQNFFFRPAAGKKEWHTAERHHSDRISGERDRHEPAQAAHFANVLFVMAGVNDRTGAEKQKRFENPCASRCMIPAATPPTPSETIIKPSCETVEYARMRLMSSWAMAMSAAISAVVTPIHTTTVREGVTPLMASTEKSG